MTINTYILVIILNVKYQNSPIKRCQTALNGETIFQKKQNWKNYIVLYAFEK